MITVQIMDILCTNRFQKRHVDVHKLNLQLNPNLGPRIIIDKIVVPKELASQQNLIKEIIGIKEKDEFNQENINSISSKLGNYILY